MTKLAKSKRDFRKSKKWKDFRHKKNVEQKGIDPITKHKLCKGANCHHRKVTSNEEEYSDLSNENDFVMLNNMTHKMLHWLYTYWKKDPSILERINDELSKWY